MMRYDTKETAVYIQVRTVVWQDGAASPSYPIRVETHLDPCVPNRQDTPAKCVRHVYYII